MSAGALRVRSAHYHHRVVIPAGIRMLTSSHNDITQQERTVVQVLVSRNGFKCDWSPKAAVTNQEVLASFDWDL
jgi:hypothetical protein